MSTGLKNKANEAPATAVTVLPVPPIPCTTTELVQRSDPLGVSSTPTSSACTGRSNSASSAKCAAVDGTAASASAFELAPADCEDSYSCFSPARSTSVLTRGHEYTHTQA